MSLPVFRQAVVDWIEANIEPLEDVKPYGGKVDIEEMMHLSTKTPAALVSVMNGDELDEESADGNVGIAIFIIGRDLVNPKRSRDDVTLGIVSELHRLLPDAVFSYTGIRRGPFDIKSRNLYDLKSQKKNTIIWGIRFDCWIDLIEFDDSLLPDLNKAYVDVTPVVDVIQPGSAPPPPAITGPSSWNNYVALAASYRYGANIGYNPDDGTLCCSGGRYGTQKTTETDILDIDSGLWTFGPSWTTYAHEAATVMARDTDGKIKQFCFGGLGSKGSNMIGVSPRSVKWDPATGQITALAQHTPYYRGAACWDGADKIYLGCGHNFSTGYKDYFWVYTISTDTMDEVSLQQCPVALSGPQMFYRGGLVFLSGGWGGAGVSGDTYVFDTTDPGAGWVNINKPMPVPVAWAAYFDYKGHNLVAGGWDAAGGQKSTQRFDPDAKEWTQEGDLLYERVFGGGGTHGDNAYVAYGTLNFSTLNSFVEVGTP